VVNTGGRERDASNAIIYGTPFRGLTILYENVITRLVCALLLKFVVRCSKITGDCNTRKCVTCERKFIIAKHTPKVFHWRGGMTLRLFIIYV
jgi:hypothetical protein